VSVAPFPEFARLDAAIERLPRDTPAYIREELVIAAAHLRQRDINRIAAHVRALAVGLKLLPQVDRLDRVMLALPVRTSARVRKEIAEIAVNLRQTVLELAKGDE